MASACVVKPCAVLGTCCPPHTQSTHKHHNHQHRCALPYCQPCAVLCPQEINGTLWALGNSTEVPQRLLQLGVAAGTVQAVRDAVRALSGVLYSSECLFLRAGRAEQGRLGDM